MNARARVIATLLLCLGLPGCQLIVDFDRSRIVERDAGQDGGGTDGGTMDAGDDAGPDDAGPDDAGADDAGADDAGADDAGTDAGMADAGTDAGMVDGGTDAGMTCGNGMVEGIEACDDGNTTTETACVYGTPTCTACNEDCTLELSLTGPFCGDGIQNGTETCDDGASNGTYGSCNDACTGVLECGDGIVSGPEECEPPGTATCDATCIAIP